MNEPVTHGPDMLLSPIGAEIRSLAELRIPTLGARRGTRGGAPAMRGGFLGWLCACRGGSFPGWSQSAKGPHRSSLAPPGSMGGPGRPAYSAGSSGAAAGRAWIIRA